MKKLPIENDLFGSPEDDWVDPVRAIKHKLGSVRNSYVGNKRKILPDLASFLFRNGLHEKIVGGKVLDLFAGSSFVGYMFKAMGAAVWSNEILTSSYLNAVCLVENSEVSITADQMLKYLKPIAGTVGPASKFVGVRFTEEEALILDSFLVNMSNNGLDVRSNIDLIAHAQKIPSFGMPYSRTSPKTAYESCFCTLMLIHYVMTRCFVGGRLNNGQILAKLEHRLEHNRNQGIQMSFNDILPYNLVINKKLNCIATKMDAVELLDVCKPDVDLIYIDPPYGGDQSDYGGMYSFFEEYLGAGETSGSERFVKSKTYDQSFDELLSKLPQKAAWMFSYNDDSWEDLDAIESHIKAFGNRQILSKEIDYDYQYRSKDKAPAKEYVIVALP